MNAASQECRRGCGVGLFGKARHFSDGRSAGKRRGFKMPVAGLRADRRDSKGDDSARLGRRKTGLDCFDGRSNIANDVVGWHREQYRVTILHQLGQGCCADRGSGVTRDRL